MDQMIMCNVTVAVGSDEPTENYHPLTLWVCLTALINPAAAVSSEEAVIKPLYTDGSAPSGRQTQFRHLAAKHIFNKGCWRPKAQLVAE